MRPRREKPGRELDGMPSALGGDWELNESVILYPAAGSAAELRLKLAVAKG